MKKPYLLISLIFCASTVLSSCGFSDHEKEKTRSHDDEYSDFNTPKADDDKKAEAEDEIEYFGDDWYEAEKLERKITGTWVRETEGEPAFGLTMDNSYKLVLKKNGKVVYTMHSICVGHDLFMDSNYIGKYVMDTNEVRLIISREESSFHMYGDEYDGSMTDEDIKFSYFGHQDFTNDIHFTISEQNGKTVLLLAGDKDRVFHKI